MQSVSKLPKTTDLPPALLVIGAKDERGAALDDSQVGLQPSEAIWGSSVLSISSFFPGATSSQRMRSCKLRPGRHAGCSSLPDAARKKTGGTLVQQVELSE